RDMEMYDSSYGDDPKEYYASGPVAPFEVELEGYNPSFLVEDGFFVASALQDHGSGGLTTRPDPAALSVCKAVNW
ncbi:MAG: hypothetical protein V3W11_10660, partial [bacterium]